MSGMRQVQLPADLCDLVQERFGAKFQSTEQLLTYVLEELVRDQSFAMEKAERTLIDRRLKDLGYL